MIVEKFSLKISQEWRHIVKETDNLSQIETLLAENEELKKEVERLKRTKEVLKKSVRKVCKRCGNMAKYVTTDCLTQIPNRAYIKCSVEKMIANANRCCQSWGLLIIDIDFFKKVNDKYGHNFGDIVLKNVAQMLQAVSRKGDCVVRWGGEEFVIFVFDVNSIQSLEVIAQRYRKAIEALQINNDDDNVSVTVSIGACFIPKNSSVEIVSAVACADAALYRAKNNGRNCVIASERRKKERE